MNDVQFEAQALDERPAPTAKTDGAASSAGPADATPADAGAPEKVIDPEQDETAPQTERRGGRILVVGASGAFGSRLVEGLVATSDHLVILAGRRRHALEDLATRLRSQRQGASLEIVEFDRKTASADEIIALDPIVVVDAAGPFQGDDLSFVREVIKAKRHYVDLADARDFIANFPHILDEAREAGVLAITGASTTPAISCAALRLLAGHWTRIDSVEISIAPGAAGPRGESVVKAILSYAGRPVPVLVDGEWRNEPGWGMTVKRRLHGLGARWLSLCETPDLDLIPEHFPSVGTTIFRASGGGALLHLGLWALSLPVRLGLVSSLKPITRLLAALASRMGRFGSNSGGMTVRASGIDAHGESAVAEWSLLATDGDGPYVPTLPALALVRGIADARPTEDDAGAFVASQIVDISLVMHEARRLRITTDLIRSSPAAKILMERAVGPVFRLLPVIVRQVHTPREGVDWQGSVDVEGAERPLGRLVASLIGFPETAEDASAHVSIQSDGDAEVWTRNLAGRSFKSRLRSSPEPGQVVESFGPVSFDLWVRAGPDGFHMEVVGWKLLGVRLPLTLAPTTVARATSGPRGDYRFDVAIEHRWLGRLVRYKGSLKSTPAQGTQP